MKNEINAPNIVNIGNAISLNEWLSKTEKALQEQGYEKATVKPHNDAAYFFYKDSRVFNAKYQILLYFFDYRQFGREEIGVQFSCDLVQKEYAIGFSASNVGNHINLQKFEAMAKAFFETMEKF